MAVVIVAFVLENTLAVTPGTKSGPSTATLFAMGGLSRDAIVSGGQWYRLFTAPFLHASVPHLIGNGIALLIGGMVLEYLVGWLWFLALFAVSALGGSLVSLMYLPPRLVSVGVSGAIMGLFAALLVCSFRMPAGTGDRTKLQIYSLRIIIPSLIPLFGSRSGIHVDYGAHFGGAFSGAALAALSLLYWEKTDRIPRLRTVAAGLVIAGTVALVASAAIAAWNFPRSDAVPVPAPTAAATDGRAAKTQTSEPDRTLGKCTSLFPKGQGAVPGINCTR